MRVLEIITILFLLFIIIERMIRRNHIKPLWEYAIIILAILHIIIEGARWQMYGIYAIIVLVIFCSVKSIFKDTKKLLWMKRWPYIIGITITLFSMLLIFLFPVKDIRKPIGQYKVGTMSYDLTDENRVELYGNRKGEERKIRIQLWYPTNDDTSGDTSPWIEDGVIVPRELMKTFNVPFFVYDHITLIDSNSYKDAPLNNEIKKLPVVIISHGWNGFRNLHTDLGELFASIGYLAISIDHTYGSVGLVFDNGKVATLDPNALPDRDETDEFLLYAGNLVDTYSKDTKTVIDHLEYLNNNSSMFKEHVNLDLIGVIGHSTGGGGVVKQAINSSMIDVVIGLDPWVEPIDEKLLSEGLNQPSMFFRSSSWDGGINEEYIKILTSNEKSNISIYEISGSKHQDLTMLYQMGPAPSIIGISGDIDGYKSADIQQSFIANFMNHHLLGKKDETDSLLAKYKKVFEVNHK